LLASSDLAARAFSSLAANSSRLTIAAFSPSFLSTTAAIIIIIITTTIKIANTISAVLIGSFSPTFSYTVNVLETDFPFNEEVKVTIVTTSSLLGTFIIALVAPVPSVLNFIYLLLAAQENSVIVLLGRIIFETVSL